MEETLTIGRHLPPAKLVRSGWRERTSELMAACSRGIRRRPAMMLRAMPSLQLLNVGNNRVKLYILRTVQAVQPNLAVLQPGQ